MFTDRRLSSVLTSICQICLYLSVLVTSKSMVVPSTTFMGIQASDISLKFVHATHLNSPAIIERTKGFLEGMCSHKLLKHYLDLMGTLFSHSRQ